MYVPTMCAMYLEVTTVTYVNSLEELKEIVMELGIADPCRNSSDVFPECESYTETLS
jgi:hypothetical protein